MHRNSFNSPLTQITKEQSITIIFAMHNLVLQQDASRFDPEFINVRGVGGAQEDPSEDDELLRVMKMRIHK